MSLARLLAHDEPIACTAKTFVPVEFANELAKQLRAERLSQRLFRLLPPDSIMCAPEFKRPKSLEETPLDLPLAELHGLKFRPQNPAKAAHVRRNDAIAVIGAYSWE